MAVLLSISGCSSSRPIVADVPPAAERAGAVESFPAVEYRHGLFGSTEPREEGVLEVSPEYLVWVVRGNDVLALRNEVIGEVWLNCAERPGDDPMVMVEVINSSPEPDGSYRTYWLRVPPTMRDWRCRR